MYEMLKTLKENDGLTLKEGKAITYKSGYQVADYEIERKTLKAAVRAVEKMGGNCGIWYSEGIYYIDHSFRVNTKKEALRIGKEHNQISVLKWANMSLVYVKEA